MRLIAALCLLAAGAGALNAPARLSRAGRTAFAAPARLGGDGARARVARAGSLSAAPRRVATSASRARIAATAIDLPPIATAKSEADDKLVKYVMDRGGKRVRACARGTIGAAAGWCQITGARAAPLRGSRRLWRGGTARAQRIPNARG